MELDRVLLDALFRQELENLGPLISLELDNSSHILIFNQSSIARKLLERHSVSYLVTPRSAEKETDLLELFKNLLIVVL